MFNTAINTIRPNHHVWSISRVGEIGVMREGVAATLSEAMRKIRKAKKEAKQK